MANGITAVGLVDKVMGLNDGITRTATALAWQNDLNSRPELEGRIGQQLGDALHVETNLKELQYQFNQATTQMLSDSNSYAQRAIYGAFALAIGPAAGLEMMLDGAVNMPSSFFHASDALGQSVAEFQLASTLEDTIVAGLSSVANFSGAFSSGVGMAAPFVAPLEAVATNGGTAANPTQLYRLGESAAPLERTFDHALSPQLYVEDVAAHYRINLSGSGQKISVMFDETLAAGKLGVTYAAEGGKVIRIGPGALVDQATTANTIAHELSHARDYLRGFHKPHGFEPSIGDGSVYGAGNALEAWIKGNR